MPEETQILYRLALVVGLGLLIGMQRERVDDPLAGFRTFPLDWQSFFSGPEHDCIASGKTAWTR